jgi:hypothetical protein
LGTDVVGLIKVRALDRVEGNFGRAYWIGSALAGEVGR